MSDKFSETDRMFMRRALQLARFGEGNVSPNPMVGAVIVSAEGRIIGEGYHRRIGGPHAEVNAVASVKETDGHLLPESTIYVTLEPCSHYGKTPPCSLLLIEKGIGRIVVGAVDPFVKVSGRGISMLREAGCEVLTGCLEKECMFLNRRFFTAHINRRPWILLKWARSSDGFIASYDKDGNKIPVKFSTPLSSALVHRERSLCDAIMVGTDTLISDNPTLTTRLWPGRSPRPVIFSSSRLPADAAVLRYDPIMLDHDMPLDENMSMLYEKHGVTSLMVEGGAALLNSFLNAGLFDEIRIETSPLILHSGVESPLPPAHLPVNSVSTLQENFVETYISPHF